ncbi:MAG: DUF481 domain-containing protein [Gammaproteobacteria bacterium]|nr:DUF481 domain-containing protein [Gammaproteobacteria bacterium]NIN63003.1 DUF481 domain-containing protein [Gammaproteobacteria bacterium]NIO63299.1 DUF481 domain-containing protein [Gammaproteobacteria bacterium]NIP50004.1 DUF481 domain-containing protein [Gammaproteobacteria bacterium]NIQ12223.1 DUF481 domain-containing protein [Gammaproteobacteria bacterium]
MVSKRFILIFSVYTWLFSTHGANAGGPTASPATESTKDKPEQLSTWESSKPPATKFDWIQLKSGEWLKGEIKGLYNDKLTFDSKKLKLLEFDWNDIKYLKTHIPFTAFVENHGTVYGYFEITSDKLIVTNGNQVREFNRRLLVSLARGGDKEIDNWSAKLTLGLNVRGGNTDQVEYNAKAAIKRETSLTRFIMNYIGNISLTSNVETANSHRVDFSHDIFRTTRFFIRPLFGEYFRDPFQNIDYKITLGAGLGYSLIKTSKTDWIIAGGPAYQVTRFISVEAGKDERETTPAMVIGQYYETELTNWLDYYFTYNITWGDQKSGGYTHHIVNTLEVDLTKRLELDVSFIWDRVDSPTRQDDGIIPKNDDYRFLVGITLDF